MTTRHTFWTSHRAAAALPAGVLSRDRLAVLAGLVVPLALAVVLAPFRASFPDTDAALALLLTVVAVAANGNRLAGVLASASATVWFDFFLTRPYERFAIAGRTDIETTILLLVIGVAITEIAVWGRRQHAAASRRAGYLDGISAAARAVATGDSPAALIEQVSAQLTDLLSLSSCRFQYGVAGSAGPPGCSGTAGSQPEAGHGASRSRACRTARIPNCSSRRAACSRAGS
jgi:K+-sensing histidine kinase KdpD